MAKQKVGLHKQVSEIFYGVPIPKKAGADKLVKISLSNRLDFLCPKRRESTLSVDTKISAGHVSATLSPADTA